MPSRPTSRSDAKRAFVRTYDHPTYEDPWDSIEAFERVQRYAAAHPQQGSYAVSKALELPRGRIRSWVDGESMPDCYRGLQTALSNGWIEDSWADEAIRALNCLAAWILSSGAINVQWVPTFVADTDDERAALHHYASRAGVGLKRTRSSETDRPPEWRPTTDGTVLGRVIYTWTGIKGSKNPESVDFPPYLETAPDHVVLAFLKVYVQQRGSPRPDRNGEIQVNAKRSEVFKTELKRTLRRFIDDPDDVRGESWPLRIRGQAAETLRQYPEIGPI